MESLVTVQELYQIIDQFAPFSTQLSFDNSGFLVGESQSQVSHVLVALDITSQVIQEAIQSHCQLIVTHHPVIFTPLKALTDQSTTAQLLMTLVRHNIAVISAHTNLDMAQGGVNDHLAQALHLSQISVLAPEGQDAQGRPYGIGRVGKVHSPGLSGADYAQFVKTALHSNGLRIVEGGRPVSKVAVGGGSCGSMLSQVAQLGCDTFVTGDVKYDQFLAAKEQGITLIDGGHFPTEQVVCPPFVALLQKQCPGLTVSLSQCHQEVYQGF